MPITLILTLRNTGRKEFNPKAGDSGETKQKTLHRTLKTIVILLYHKSDILF